MTDHQKKQIEAIDHLEKLVKQKSDLVSAVTETEDYEHDTRICLTSVHFLSDSFKQKIQQKVIVPLKEAFPGLHFYSDKSLHITVKNIRVISDPPTFNSEDIETVKRVFAEVIPKHNKFTFTFLDYF